MSKKTLRRGKTITIKNLSNEKYKEINKGIIVGLKVSLNKENATSIR